MEVPLTDEVAESVRPTFIYGGPFIPAVPDDGFLNMPTPVNSILTGAYRKSFAHVTLKDRLPVILTKVIDSLAKKGGEPEKQLIEYIAELKNELITNKEYKKFKVPSTDARNWNTWIDSAESKTYFYNIWVFSECYVYRRLREGCELIPELLEFDPFFEQKKKAYLDSIDYMCLVADEVVKMAQETDKDKSKADFMVLLKLSLWANKCDLSFSKGAEMNYCLGGSETNFVHPVTMVTDNKDKLLVDDSGKIYDTLKTKSEAMRKVLDPHTDPKYKCSCERLQAGLPPPKMPPPPKAEPPPSSPEGEESPPVIVCPTKFTSPSTVFFDLVLDNAGYELFTDLCLAYYIIEQKIADVVRIHVKKIPWFVSDVTMKDIEYMLEQTAVTTINKTYPGPPSTEPAPAPAEGESEKKSSGIVIDTTNAKALNEKWKQYIEDGTFLILQDEFWTSPHLYKDMKRISPNLYRKLQFGIAVMFKGDLNYRKLIGEKKWVPTASFDSTLQGFNPAPVMALRTVKADLICGLPKGKAESIAVKDENWMLKGEYGVIQMSSKAEALKPSTIPCEDFKENCKSNECPKRNEY